MTSPGRDTSYQDVFTLCPTSPPPQAPPASATSLLPRLTESGSFRVCIRVRSCSVWLPLSETLCSSPVLSETAGFPSFLWPDDMALYTYPTFQHPNPLVDALAAAYERHRHERGACGSLSELVISCPSDKYPGVGFPGPMGVLFVVFRGNATLPPRVAVPVPILAGSFGVPSPPDSSLSFLVSLRGSGLR